jgi:hypothetical protein
MRPLGLIRLTRGARFLIRRDPTTTSGAELHPRGGHRLHTREDCQLVAIVFVFEKGNAHGEIIP